MKRLPALILLCAVYYQASAQNLSDTARIINSLFHRYHPENPGGQLSISQNGKLIFSKAWGLADLDHQVPYTTVTVSEAGSISKQFTAVSILLLVQQGKLSLNDDVRKYFPQIPNYGSVIRLENLLHHTSGLREWSDLVAITGWPRTTKAYGNEDVFKMLCRQKKLNNVPGTEFIYSNSNYVLLTMIVEKVSGMTLPTFTQKYIFNPAGMTHTLWRDSYKKVVPNRAIAYSKNDGIYTINMPNENVYGPGGLLTTTEDLLKWNDFYLNNKLGNPGLLKQQLAIEPLIGGAETHYASGLFIDKLNGVKEIYHDGQTAGYVGDVESFPALHLSVAWLSNTTEFKPGLFDEIEQVENLFIKNIPASTDVKTENASHLKLGKAKELLGWYRYNKTNQGVKIALNKDTLYFNDTALRPINDSCFSYKSSLLKFNSSRGFVLHTEDKRDLLFTKERNAKINKQYLQAFTGNYYSSETESDFTIVIKNGKLMIEKDNIKDAILLPTYSQGFDFNFKSDAELSPLRINILFKRDRKNKVVGCWLSTSDARNICFNKIK
jgi:CubicO group peptidase (beta-lactamase class C family)